MKRGAVLIRIAGAVMSLILAAGSAGCSGKTPKAVGLDVTAAEFTGPVRTPLQAEGATMNVRISDLPGEDPWNVLPGAAPDPFVMFDNTTDYYYGMATQNSSVILHRSKVLSELFTGGEALTVYKTGAEVLESLWAPEMYFIDGRWYIYTSGKITEDDNTKHMVVLESESADPFDGFHFKAYLNNEIFGIDPTVYQNAASGRNFLCFSQVIDGMQWLSICELKTPWEITEPVPISDPRDYFWESLTDGPLNEGPFFVTSGQRLFIIYSANGCYSDTYRLGLLEYNGGDLLSKEGWDKFSEPIFVLEPDNGIYAPGHASFFYSPDHTELWIAFHCYYSRNSGAARRMRICHVQKAAFDEAGFPAFGIPLAEGTMIPVPSGE